MKTTIFSEHGNLQDIPSSLFLWTHRRTQHRWDRTSLSSLKPASSESATASSSSDLVKFLPLHPLLPHSAPVQGFSQFTSSHAGVLCLHRSWAQGTTEQWANQAKHSESKHDKCSPGSVPHSGANCAKPGILHTPPPHLTEGVHRQTHWHEVQVWHMSILQGNTTDPKFNLITLVVHI